MPIQQARAELERCCGASAWIERMCAGRPYRNRDQLFATAEAAWAALGRNDWVEAFAHHPRIGDLESLRTRFRSTADWASEEQRGAASASEDALTALAEGNRVYEDRFGYIFIVCASGKSAGEMLSLLNVRLRNDPQSELTIAAEEQMKITRLRLAKLVGDA